MSSTELVFIHEATFKSVSVGTEPTEQRDLLSMRVMVNRTRVDTSGEKTVYDDSKSYWVDAEMWLGKRRSYFEGVVQRGIQAMIIGRYVDASYEDKDSGKMLPRQKFIVEDLAISPYSIETIEYKQSAQKA